MAEKCYVTVDIGSTNIKAACVAPDGTVLSQTGKKMPLLCDGYHVEADPESMYRTIKDLIRKVVAKGDYQPESLGFACQMSGMILLDQGGRPLTNVIYGIDYRGAECQEQLEKLMDRSTIYDETGCPKSGIYLPGKLLWFGEKAPEIIRETRFVMGIKEYMLMRLTRNIIVDYASASSTQLYSRKEHVWWQEMIHEVGIGECSMPAIAMPFDTAGQLIASEARDLGLLYDLRVIVGSGDGPVSNIATGAINKGDCCISFGTTTVTRYLTKTVTLDEEKGYFCQHLYGDLYLQGIRMNDTGREISKYVKLTGGVCEEIEGVYFWDGQFHNAGMLTNGQKLHAVCDSVLFEIYDRMLPLIVKESITKFYCVGGGSKDRRWMQDLSDLFGMEVVLPQSQDIFPGIGVLCAMNRHLYADLSGGVRAMAGENVVLIPGQFHNELKNRYFQYIKFRNALTGKDGV